MQKLLVDKDAPHTPIAVAKRMDGLKLGMEPGNAFKKPYIRW